MIRVYTSMWQPLIISEKITERKVRASDVSWMFLIPQLLASDFLLAVLAPVT